MSRTTAGRARRSCAAPAPRAAVPTPSSGVAATVAALVVTGALVSDATGVRPTLTGEGVLAGCRRPLDVPDTGAVRPPGGRAARTPPGGPGDARDAAGPPSAPTTTRHGDGLVMPCQQARFADPKGTAALIRTFAPEPAAPAKADPAPMAVQTAQASSVSEKAPPAAYATTLGWFAGCGDDRAQLLDTQAIDGVGDEASLLVLRTWDGSGATLVVGVARTGELTTTTVTRTPAGKQRLASRAPPGCSLTRSPGCATSRAPGPCAHPASCGRCRRCRRPRCPAMLAEVDLPPVSGVGAALGRHRAAPGPVTNAAATTCDETDFALDRPTTPPAPSWCRAPSCPTSSASPRPSGRCPPSARRRVRRQGPQRARSVRRQATWAPRSTRLVNEIEAKAARPLRLARQHRDQRRPDRSTT